MIELSVRFKLLFIFFLPGYIFTQNYPDKAVDSLLNAGIHKILSQDYDGASATFNHLDKSYPHIPLGKIYRAACLITSAIDFAEDLNSERIEWLLETAEEQSDSLLDSDPDNLWFNYFAAISKGYSAYFEALQQKYITAFADGVISLGYFNKCLEIEPKFYESYIAIGSYKYWKSAKTESFDWLPFMTNEKEEGAKILERAVEMETYNYHVAVHSLMWIYIDKKESSKAVRTGESILRKFPEARIYKWALARAYQDIDKSKSIQIFSDLLNSYLAEKKNNHQNEIVLKHKIAMLYEQTNQPEAALRLCNDILQIKNLSSKVRENIQERLVRVEILKENLQSNLSGR
ncbi:MAG: hypothetical protein V1720_21690 [bacterium]